MANKILVFEKLAYDPATGAFFDLLFIDGGTSYNLYVKDSTTPNFPSLPSGITTVGAKPVIAPSGGGDVVGLGTTGKLPLWTDGPNSVVGDSIATQTGTASITIAGDAIANDFLFNGGGSSGLYRLNATTLFLADDAGLILSRFAPSLLRVQSALGAGLDINVPSDGVVSLTALGVATGAALTIGTLTLSGAITFPSNVRQTFAPGAANPGLNVGSVAGDPSTPSNGDVWYDSTGNLLRARINGATVSLGAGGTPGGLTTQLQRNNAGAFGGIANVTADANNITLLTVTGNIIATGTANRVGTAGTNDATADTMMTASGQTKRALTLQSSRAPGNVDPLFAVTSNSDGTVLVQFTSDGGLKTSYLASVFGSGIVTAQDLALGWSGTNTAIGTLVGGAVLTLRSSGSGASRMVVLANDTSTIGAMLQNTGGRQRVVADVTKTDTTFTNITGLGFNSSAAGKYTGRLVIKCNNSTAAEGIKFDFNGGTATVSSFWACAYAPVGGTTVLGTVISTALSGVINFTTITGETLIVIEFSLVASGAGTIIPRFAENSTATGTATVELGSFMWTESTP